MNWASICFWKTYDELEDIRMNWNTNEGIEMQTFFRMHMNEFEDTRMNWGSAFFWGGRLTNELEDIRMNWGSDFFWGRRHTNELEDIRMNWKTYE